MNRHESNPFLSDWDDNDASPAAARVQTNSNLFDAMLLTTSERENETNQNETSTSNRRSSCSQAESAREHSTNSAAGTAARAGLYRRNMSSFEAASLLDQQQHQLENGSYVDFVAAQKDLIAKMTADFQSAIQTNQDKEDQQQQQQDYENLSFNPFDPFETIVDDDSLAGPNSPLATTQNHTAATNLSTKTGDTGSGDEFVLPGGKQVATGTTTTTTMMTSKAHDSIDDDEDELISTPVRNIKSSPTGGGELQNQETKTHLDGGGGGGYDATGGQEAACSVHAEESDSIRKATLFASLLASAEQTSPGNDQGVASCDGGGGGGANVSQLELASERDPLESSLEATTRVIKGSPKSASGGADTDRPVSFFDPFETLIDEGALHSLVGESSRSRDQHSPGCSDNASPLTDETHNRLLTASVAESISVETVIENPASAANKIEKEEDRTGTSSGHQQDTPAGGLPQQQQQQTSAASSGGSRRAQPLSGIAPPQPTPMKKRTRPARQRKSSFQEDSSDSSDGDDRIQIVICPRDVRQTTENGGDAAGQQHQQPAVLVPLLPPPPSKSSMRQARERGQVEDLPSPIMGYKSRLHQQQQQQQQPAGDSDEDNVAPASRATAGSAEPPPVAPPAAKLLSGEPPKEYASDSEDDDDGGDHAFVIPMPRLHGANDDDDDDVYGDNYGKPETPLYDDDTSYVLEEFPPKYEGPGWEMMLRYPPKKKLTAARFWKKMFVKLAQVPLAPVDSGLTKSKQTADSPIPSSGAGGSNDQQTCWALQVFEHKEDKKPVQEIPIQATYTVSEISSQLYDQFGKVFTIKLQYIFYKERVGVRQGQLARFIHTGHIGTSTTSGGHGVDPISIGAIKRMGAPIEHSPQISQIIKLGCTNYEDIRVFKETIEDCLFRMTITRDRALTTYKTEEVQMAVRDETYIEINQIGTVTRQLARVRLFFLSFLNGTPTVEVGINDFHRQGREVVGRMDILPVVTEEWIRLEAWELHSTVEPGPFEDEKSRIIRLTPPDATFFELMRFRVRPPRNRELPLQVSANMSVTRTRVSINCEVMVPGCVSRKHGQIPCENIAIRIQVPEAWIYFFREEKHFRMGSKKSVNRRPGKVKGIERFLGGSGPQDFSDDSSLIEVTSGQAKYEHHHHAVVWRAARWPKESQSAYVQNTMKIRLPLTAYDKMPESFYEYVHVEYTMPATTVSHTTLRSISVSPCDDEPPEKYVKYAAKFEYKVKMRLSVNLGGRTTADTEPDTSPIVIMKQRDNQDDLQREADSDDDDDDDNHNVDDDDVDDGVDDLKSFLGATLILPKSFVISPEFNDVQSTSGSSSACTISPVKYRLYPTYKLVARDLALCGVLSKSTGLLLVVHLRFPVIKSLRTEEDSYATIVCRSPEDGAPMARVRPRGPQEFVDRETTTTGSSVNEDDDEIITSKTLTPIKEDDNQHRAGDNMVAVSAHMLGEESHQRETLVLPTVGGHLASTHSTSTRNTSTVNRLELEGHATQQQPGNTDHVELAAVSRGALDGQTALPSNYSQRQANEKINSHNAVMQIESSLSSSSSSLSSSLKETNRLSATTRRDKLNSDLRPSEPLTVTLAVRQQTKGRRMAFTTSDTSNSSSSSSLSSSSPSSSKLLNVNDISVAPTSRALSSSPLASPDYSTLVAVAAAAAAAAAAHNDESNSSGALQIDYSQRRPHVTNNPHHPGRAPMQQLFTRALGRDVDQATSAIQGARNGGSGSGGEGEGGGEPLNEVERQIRIMDEQQEQEQYRRRRRRRPNSEHTTTVTTTSECGRAGAATCDLLNALNDDADDQAGERATASREGGRNVMIAKTFVGANGTLSSSLVSLPRYKPILESDTSISRQKQQVQEQKQQQQQEQQQKPARKDDNLSLALLACLCSVLMLILIFAILLDESLSSVIARPSCP